MPIKKVKPGCRICNIYWGFKSPARMSKKRYHKLHDENGYLRDFGDVR